MRRHSGSFDYRSISFFPIQPCIDSRPPKPRLWIADRAYYVHRDLPYSEHTVGSASQGVCIEQGHSCRSFILRTRSGSFHRGLRRPPCSAIPRPFSHYGELVYGPSVSYSINASGPSSASGHAPTPQALAAQVGLLWQANPWMIPSICLDLGCESCLSGHAVPIDFGVFIISLICGFYLAFGKLLRETSFRFFLDIP